MNGLTNRTNKQIFAQAEQGVKFAGEYISLAKQEISHATWVLKKTSFGWRFSYAIERLDYVTYLLEQAKELQGLTKIEMMVLTAKASNNGGDK